MSYLSALSSSTLDPDKPTLFELIAESRLSDLLDPSLRFVLAGWTQQHPRYLLRLFNHFDEVFAVLMFIVQRHYLRKWSGSFTENFYGILRQRRLRFDFKETRAAQPALMREKTRLRKTDIYKSLFVLVAVPYIKRKLDQLHERQIASNAITGGRNNAMSTTWSSRMWRKIMQVFHQVYPWMNFGFYSAILGFHIAYMFNHSPYHHPFDYLIGVEVRRRTALDRTLDSKAPTPSTASFSSILHPHNLLDALRYALPSSVFLLQFLEWWHASPFASQLSSSTYSSISMPRPRQAEAHEKGLELPADSGICPICNSIMVDPTASQTGYVFCYKCIHSWTEEKKTCPITWSELMGGVNGLRRLRV